MRVVPTLAWSLADPAETLDARLVPLLSAIRAKSSLAAAVALCAIILLATLDYIIGPW